MKKITILFTIIFVAGNLFAQNRGVQPLNIKIQGKQVKLYDQSHALIIGNINYTNWSRLPGVAKDVTEVSKALEQNGFNVIVKENLNKSQTDKAISEFISKYGNNVENRVLIYYAGHGHTIKTSWGSELGYIVPIDAPKPFGNEGQFQSKSIEMSQFEIYAKRIQAKHSLFMFDACFSGALFRSEPVPVAISGKTKKHVRQFITSGSADQEVPDESVFRKLFVNALTTSDADNYKDGYLTGSELGYYLQVQVANFSHNSQNPQYGKIKVFELSQGDFVFILPKKENNKQNNNTVINTKIEEEDIAPLVTVGNLQITNYLQGDLYIDNTYKQLANKNKKITITDLPTGTHTIKIKTNNETWTKTVTITQNQTTKVKAISTITPTKTNRPKDLPGYFTDSRDNKRYKIVEIGNQTWMAENLAYKTSSGCWAYDNDQSNVTKYGYLYNWETAKNVCPTGWHLPTKSEFETLLNNYGNGEDNEDDWKANFTALIPSGESGFSASFGGWRLTSGGYSYIGKDGYFWSSSTEDDTYAWRLSMYSRNKKAGMSDSRKSVGLSARCLQDN